MMPSIYIKFYSWKLKSFTRVKSLECKTIFVFQQSSTRIENLIIQTKWIIVKQNLIYIYIERIKCTWLASFSNLARWVDEGSVLLRWVTYETLLSTSILDGLRLLIRRLGIVVWLGCKLWTAQVASLRSRTGSAHKNYKLNPNAKWLMITEWKNK